MTHLVLGGIPVDYEIVGAGPPVVFVHARPFAGWYGPLLAHPRRMAVHPLPAHGARRPGVRDRR